MRLPGRAAAALFAIGAAGGLAGDAAHVVSGTLAQLEHHAPRIFESAWWFPLVVGGAAVVAGELRSRSGEAPLRGAADVIAAIAAVVGLYALTALAPDGPVLPLTVLVWALAVLAWRTLGGATAVAAGIGAAAAVIGSAAEVALVEAGWFAYAEPIDALAGVPPWLPGLYFAFGAVASGLGPALASRE